MTSEQLREFKNISALGLFRMGVRENFKTSCTSNVGKFLIVFRGKGNKVFGNHHQIERDFFPLIHLMLTEFNSSDDSFRDAINM